jgi:hypothetical protein
VIRHCVLIALRSPEDRTAALDAMETLAGLVGTIDGMVDFAHGPNRDFEGKSQRYDIGFIATFADRAAHLRYEAHPVHVAAGATLVRCAAGGHDGIFVADIETD